MSTTATVNVPEGMEPEIAQDMFDTGFEIFRESFAMTDEGQKQATKDALAVTLGIVAESCVSHITSFRNIFMKYLMQTNDTPKKNMIVLVQELIQNPLVNRMMTLRKDMFEIIQDMERLLEEPKDDEEGQPPNECDLLPGDTERSMNDPITE
jgi:hypothetical protein